MVEERLCGNTTLSRACPEPYRYFDKGPGNVQNRQLVAHVAILKLSLDEIDQKFGLTEPWLHPTCQSPLANAKSSWHPRTVNLDRT